MKSITSIIGILLILGGAFIFAYQGFSFTQREDVAQIGGLTITADKEKTVYFPPFLGAGLLVAGVVFLVVGMRKK